MGQPISVENPIHTHTSIGGASFEIPSLDVEKVNSNHHRKSLNFSEIIQQQRESPKLITTPKTSPKISGAQHQEHVSDEKEMKQQETTLLEEGTATSKDMSLVTHGEERNAWSRLEKRTPSIIQQKHFSISAVEYHRSSSRRSGDHSLLLSSSSSSPTNSSTCHAFNTSDKKKEHQRSSSSPRNLLNSFGNEGVNSETTHSNANRSSQNIEITLGRHNKPKNAHVRPLSISTLDNLGFNGINKILQDKLLLQQFRNYTKIEYSEENLDIFLLANQLLEECKKFLEEDENHHLNSSGFNTSVTSRKNQHTNQQKIEEKNKQQQYKILQSHFSFEEKILKKLEKQLEQIFEKMQKIHSEKRKSLMKSRRKNSEFFGIDRNMFKQQAHSAGVFEASHSLFDDEDVFSSSLSFGSSGSSSLDGLNVTHKLKNQIEKIRAHNLQQQQWLASKRVSKRMSLKFFTHHSNHSNNQSTSTSANAVVNSSHHVPTSLMDHNTTLNQETLAQLSTLIQEMESGNSNAMNNNSPQSPILSALVAMEEPTPQIQIVQFLEDLRFEMFMNLKDTYIRFCQQNKLVLR
ncbi:hypothetical protein FDP41_008862 [Naegleria fowleri]|uniref:RGS domain-containing protein n=1 Tax=Naegleria fowleri TaxID=5763 RepID=A0A6A5AYR3_NAEFO|nr:uncharacterized protein FDP41_008862 [Naegleria fowleri]KAF0972613.1 hypothetical protein FDP41_008862 [Naegleria fowleri]CAG4715555.1 unnamed protein product [Naegleria fowleri]